MENGLTKKVDSILGQSHDGSDLNPADYIVVVKSIDTPPSATDVQRINEIYDSLTAGTYPTFKSWFWNVENLQRREDNKLYWRQSPVAFSRFRSPLEECEAARELGRRCRHLESIGVAVTVQSVDWQWAWFDGIPKNHAYLTLLARFPMIWEMRASDGSQGALAFMIESDNQPCWLIWNGESCSIQKERPASFGWLALRAERMHWRELTKLLQSYNVPPDVLDI